jgi:SAM-dependent methyltransferase
MKPEDNYLKINKKSWNDKTAIHLNSDFYDMPNFLKGNTSLNEIELAILGDVSGKRILHLQCHFGQDTISLERMGATTVGVDLSDKAIATAQELAITTKADATFVCSDIYDLPNHLEGEFDIVFTSYGTIGWLPDLGKWAKIIQHFLKPKGQFLIVEFHPVVWMFDDDFKFIKYNYFKDGAIIETESGTYADKKAAISQDYVMWNHSISEVMNSLIQNNISIKSFDEYDYSPYNCFNKTIKIAAKKYRIKHLKNKIPMVYALLGEKK